MLPKVCFAQAFGPEISGCYLRIAMSPGISGDSLSLLDSGLYLVGYALKQFYF